MPSAKNETKNQHYVPQFLLRNFSADDRGQVCVFDKQEMREFTTSTRNVASETGFYDFVIEGEKRTVESAMTEIENRAALVVDGILKRESLGHLSVDDKITLSVFAAVQNLRTKGHRYRMESIATGLRNCLLERGIDPGDVVPEIDENDAKMLSIASIQSAKEEARYFYEKAWLLERSPEGCGFYTSDHPVTRYNVVNEGKVGLASTGVELHLPISPQFSICFVCDKFSRMILNGVNVAAIIKAMTGVSTEGADEIRQMADSISSGQPSILTQDNVVHQNSLQVIYSSRFVISADGAFELAKSMVKGDPSLRKPRGVTVT